MSDADYTEQVVDTNTKSVHINEPAVPIPTETAEALGVDQASFDKYNRNAGFDWASYGKEQAFKQAQRAGRDIDAGVEGNAESDDRFEETAEIEASVESAGLDWDDLGHKVITEGDISQEDYDALEGIGIPPEVIHDYINAVQGQAQGIIDSVIDGFGGQEEFDAVYAELHTSATVEQRNKLDALLRDPDTREAGIMQAYRIAGMQPQAPGTQGVIPQAQPQPSRGNAAPAAPAAKGFTSFNEQVAAQSDPRYRTDPSYREQVLSRIASSTWEMNPRTGGAGM